MRYVIFCCAVAALACWSVVAGAACDDPPNKDVIWIGCDKQGVDLRDEDLRGAIMTRSDLRGANFSGTNLSHADLNFANLQGAQLSGARMNSARLVRTNLTDIGPHSAALNSRARRCAGPPCTRAT